MASNSSLCEEDSDKISKLHMINLDLTLVITKLQEEHEELKLQISEEKEELQNVCEEKTTLKNKLERASNLFYELEGEVGDLKSLLLTATQKNDDLEKKNSDLERKLVSLQNPNETNPQLHKKLERELEFKGLQIEKLENELKSEREKSTAQNTELLQMRIDLAKKTVQVDAANRRISRKESELSEFRSIISSQRRREVRSEDKIRSLESELKNMRDDLWIHKALVEHQKQQTEQLKGQEQQLVNIQNENTILKKICSDFSEKRALVRDGIKRKISNQHTSIVHLQQVITEMEIAHEYEKLKSDSCLQTKETEIKIIREKHDKLMNFVEKLGKITEYRDNEKNALSIENQLGELEAHILIKWRKAKARKFAKTARASKSSRNLSMQPILTQKPQMSTAPETPPPLAPPLPSTSTKITDEKLISNRFPFHKELNANEGGEGKRPRLSTNPSGDNSKCDDKSKKTVPDAMVMEKNQEPSVLELRIVFADTDEDVDVEGI